MMMKASPILLAAALLGGTAGASALLETTPACEVITEAEASAILGETMSQQGGSLGLVDSRLSDCRWNGTDRMRLEVSFSPAETFASQARSAIAEFNAMMAAMAEKGEPLELVGDLGQRAAVAISGETVFVYLVEHDSYLTISATGAARAAAIRLAEAALPRM